MPFWGAEMLLLRALRTLILGIVVGGVAVGACLAALIPGAAEVVSAHHYTVKTVTKLRELSQKSTVYWSDGSKMEDLGLQDREIVQFKDIPVRVVNAVIATEDQTFWTNDGIDLGAVFRAFVSNVTSGKIEQGGSTITQQLVKNRILSPARDVNRKVKEIEDALRLNEKFSKPKILEEYLNTVYFGQNSYGIKSAASRFFITQDNPDSYPRGKRLDELTIGEAALLAGVIANPEGTNPFTYPQRTWLRRADVLQIEVDQGYITQAEADAAKNEPLPTSLPPDQLRPSNYLVAEVQDRLLNDTRLGLTPKARHDALLKGGLQIYTTFDWNLQNLATAATQDALPRSPSGPDWVSSLVAIEPATGAVKAMVGGPDFADSEYNIATHPVGRQPGSTWKVMTLATVLANGYSPNDSVNGNAPCSVPSKFGTAATINAEGGGGGYESIWAATAGSVNCAFVRLSTSVGQDKVMEMAHKMGITQQRLFPHLTLSIGDIEATPLEMATVIATIANGGVHQAPYFVQNVVGSNGLPLPGFPEIDRPGDRVLAQDVAECEQILLRGVITGGTGTGYTEVPGHEPFGKTGTTDNLGDAWFIGATPQLATAVWFGNRTTNALRAGFGGPTSGPIWRQFMQDALADQPNIPLPDRGSNAVCNRPGKAVNEDGGRAALVIAPEPSDTPVISVTPRQPTVTPGAPTTSRPVLTVPGLPGHGKP
ncbi:MAG: transglycosylase domain-containing protein [Acidimicrobiia bacterium]